MVLLQKETKTDENLLAASPYDHASFEELVRRYQYQFLHFALRMTHHAEDAQDVIQEAFLRIYRYAAHFQQQEGASFKSWALHIIRNVAIDHYRQSNKILDEAGDIDRIADQQTYIDPARIVEAKLDLLHLVNSLSLDSRDEFMMYYLQDKSYREIARERKIPISTVRMRIFHAREYVSKLTHIDEKTHLVFDSYPHILYADIPKLLRDSMKQYAISLVREGWKFESVAQYIGVSKGTVSKWVKKEKLKNMPTPRVERDGLP